MVYYVILCCVFFFVKQKTAYEMRISDWSSDVCSSDLVDAVDVVGVDQVAVGVDREVVVAECACPGFGAPRTGVGEDHRAAVVREAADDVAAVAGNADKDRRFVGRAPLRVGIADGDLGAVEVLGPDPGDQSGKRVV